MGQQDSGKIFEYHCSSIVSNLLIFISLSMTILWCSLEVTLTQIFSERLKVEYSWKNLTYRCCPCADCTVSDSSFQQFSEFPNLWTALWIRNFELPTILHGLVFCQYSRKFSLLFSFVERSTFLERGIQFCRSLQCGKSFSEFPEFLRISSTKIPCKI